MGKVVDLNKYREKKEKLERSKRASKSKADESDSKTKKGKVRKNTAKRQGPAEKSRIRKPNESPEAS
tara:strand:+ start:1965 stop:2165 length:201 start_codon:yes stop_codon:yes gene_type:complete